MGRALFAGFVTADPGAGARGVRFGEAFTAWDELYAAGRARASLLVPGGAYVVDPAAGLESVISLFAVGVLADTFLLWAQPTPALGRLHPVAPALYATEGAWWSPMGRPVWGIPTSGTSGTAKIPCGYADALELVALHYMRAILEPTFPDAAEMPDLATCLPLQYSAAFFMALLPALFMRRNLLLFEPHDWRPFVRFATGRRVVCVSVPSVTEAGLRSTGTSRDMSSAALLLGAGHLAQARVDALRERLPNVLVNNIYGTAETGAVAVDRDPGHATYVGRPFAGKPVWIQDADEQGVGLVATVGPDCRSFFWTPQAGLEAASTVVTGTDYGHVDSCGNLYLDGRVDAGEKVHGVIVYTRAIERHLLRLAGVVDARVTVVRTDAGDEFLAARVVGTATREAVRDHCEALPPAERPRRVVVEDGEAAYSPHGKLAGVAAP